MARALMLFWMILITGAAQAGKQPSNQPGNPPGNMCAPLIRWHEATHGIPRNLLTAISLVESGRKIGSAIVPWPWTLNANGKPYVFASKQEAISMVRKLRLIGITSIDVGCMQVNLKQHPKAFPTLEAAFDPAANIAYAAKFLKAKKRGQGSWMGAVAHYHSSTAKFHVPYKMKVLKTWLKAQQNQRTIHAPFMAQQAPTETPYPGTDKHEGEFIQNVVAPSGRQVPVVVRFAPYKGFKENTISGSLMLHRTAPKIIRGRPTGSGKIIVNRIGLNRFGMIPLSNQKPVQIFPKLP